MARAPLSPLARKGARRSVLWRIHLWAAVIATPFTLVAALTGMLYVLTPQIEAFAYAALDHVSPTAAMAPLDASVAAARTAAPAGWQLQSVLPPYAAGDTVKAVFEPPRASAAGAPAQPGHAEHAGHAGHAGHSGHQLTAPAPAPASTARVARAAASALTVYVDPATARVVGSMRGEERFGHWAKRLHSRLLQGDGWRWMIELAASAMMVMLISGLLLWWPASVKQAVPRAGLRGRAAWKQWHGTLGAALAVLTLVIVATGLTWSLYAGAQIRSARDMLGQASPRPPLHLASGVPVEPAPLSWQQAWDITRRQAPDVAVQLSAPREALGVWRISAADTSRPTRKFDLLLDNFSGAPLYYAGWQQQTLFGKATAIGIPFHRGEFGWWNQALLLLFGAGVLFSLLSGWVMWGKRHRPGAAWLPPLAAGAWRSSAVPLAGTCVLGAWWMPLAAVAAGVVLVIEVVLARGHRAA